MRGICEGRAPALDMCIVRADRVRVLHQEVVHQHNVVHVALGRRRVCGPIGHRARWGGPALPEGAVVFVEGEVLEKRPHVPRRDWSHHLALEQPRARRGRDKRRARRRAGCGGGSGGEHGTKRGSS